MEKQSTILAVITENARFAQEIVHIMNSEIKKKRISKKKFGKIKNVNYICGVNFFHFVWIRMLFGTTSREVRSPFFLEKCENHTIFALEKCEIME